MSILLNSEFIKNELVENTICYLNDEEKSFLLKEGEEWYFNGTGFKNITKLKHYIQNRTFINEKELIMNIDSPSRRTNPNTIEKLYTLFKKDTPIFIDTEKLYKMLLLSSNSIFSPNEKICFTIMFENPYKAWSAKEIIKEAQKNISLELSIDKIEESLNRYLEKDGRKGALVSYEIKANTNFYRINFTNFIFYIQEFYKSE